MAKKLYIVTRNHMDPSWRRCFEEHFHYDGGIVRPYSDIEETLFTQYMDAAEKYGFVFSIEQTYTIKRFLYRNPDLFLRFKKLVKAGKIEILGGGEAIIDYNMPCGESMVRSHYYNIKYCMKEFGVRPAYADCADTFGLPAQLPQVLRQFGYDAITYFSRVFRDAKPVWKGLDGSMIVIKINDVETQDAFYGDFYKYTACTGCAGEGCRHCDQTGIDYSYNFETGSQNIYGKTIDTLLADIKREEKDYYILMMMSEETKHAGDFVQVMKKKAHKLDLEVEFMSNAAMIELQAGSYIDAVRAGRVLPGDIDPRVEGNPMATGCLVSRIELKRLNRELENLLLAAETLAAIAYEGNTKL